MKVAQNNKSRISCHILLTLGGLASAQLLHACATGVHIYPQNGFQQGSLPAKRPEEVQVHFGNTVPACGHRDLGTLLYDAFTDRSLQAAAVSSLPPNHPSALAVRTGTFRALEPT